jgi:hypothetical protein
MLLLQVEEIKKSLSMVRIRVERMKHFLFQFSAVMATVNAT